MCAFLVDNSGQIFVISDKKRLVCAWKFIKRDFIEIVEMLGKSAIGFLSLQHQDYIETDRERVNETGNKVSRQRSEHFYI